MKCPTCGQDYHADEVCVDPDTGIVYYQDKSAQLTHTEAKLMEALVRAMPRLLDRDQLMGAMYEGRIEDPDWKIVDVFICKVRKKLKGTGLDIHNVWSRGWQLVTEGD